MSQSGHTRLKLNESYHTATELPSDTPSLAYRRRNDRSWTMEFLSDGCEKLTGYPPDDLIENRRIAYGDLIHPDDRKAVWSIIQNAVVRERPFHVTYRLTAANGVEKWIREQGRCVQFTGVDPGLLEGFLVDITPQKDAETSLQVKRHELKLLQEAWSEVGDGELQEMLRVIAARAVQMVDGTGAALKLYGPGADVVRSVVTMGDYVPAIDSKREGSADLCSQVVQSGQCILVDHDRTAADKGNSSDEHAGQGTHIGVPLRHAGKVLGVLEVVAKAPGAFSQHDADLLGLLAAQAAIAVRNAQLHDEVALHVRHQAIINRVSRAVSRALDLDTLTEVVYREIESPFDPDAFFIALYDVEANELTYRFQVDGGKVVPPERVPLRRGLTASVITRQEPLLIQDYERERQNLPPGELWGTMETPASWLGVPMQVADRTVGVICVQAYRRHAYSPADQQLLSTIAEQVGIAVENARLYEEISLRLAQTQVLREFMFAAASTLDADAMLARTLGSLHISSAAPECVGFAVPDWHSKSLRFHPSSIGFGEEACTLTSGAPSCAWGRAYLTGEPILVDNVPENRPRHAGDADVRSAVAVPVRVDGEIAGILSVGSSRPHTFDQQDLDFYATIGGQLSVALENARLFQAEQEQRQQTEALQEAAAVVTGTLDFDQVLGRILEQVERVIRGDAFNVVVIQDEHTAHVVRRHGYEGDDMDVVSLCLDRYPLLLEMMSTGNPLVVPDTAAEPSWLQREGQQQWRSYVAAPIKVGGVVVGFLNVNAVQAGTFSGDEAQRLKAFADHVATAIENAQLYQELHNHAEVLEERVRERTSQLRSQYAQLRTILDSTADGIVLARSDGELILTNPVAQRWLTQALSPEESDQLREAVRTLAMSAERRPERILELTGLDLQLAATPVSGPTVEGASAVVAMHDITHLKALSRMKSRFVSNVSHELRTPITTIKLLVHLMIQHPEKRDEYLEPLMREAEHQAKLVQDILEMSRVDAGRLEIRPEPMSLNRLARMAVVNYEKQVKHHGLTLEYQGGDDELIVTADSRWMLQVINNLLSNAMNYTPPPGTIRVSTGTAHAGARAWATVTVSDTGIGIPESELPYVFDRFFRGEQPQAMQISGTGLGLAIVKEIVEIHGGRVTVESALEKGSSFIVSLPHQPR